MKKILIMMIVLTVFPLILIFSVYRYFNKVKVVTNDVETTIKKENVESNVKEETPARKKRADRPGVYRRSFKKEKTIYDEINAKYKEISADYGKISAGYDKISARYDEMNAELREMNAVRDEEIIKPVVLERSDTPIEPADTIVKVSEEHSIDLRKHTLIAGRSGSGKSVALNTMIKQLQKNENIDIVVLDPKRVSFNKFEGIEVIKDIDSMHKTLTDIKLEMELRYELMDDMKLEKFNSECGFKSKVLIIDETSRLFNGVDVKRNKEAIALVTELIELGRACDISIIVATQTPSRKNIPTNIQNNIANILCFEVKDASASRAVFDEKNDAHTINNSPGEFRLKSADMREIVSGKCLML